jgi:preprotein translocase subunit SecA
MLNIFASFLDANKRTLNELSKIVTQINILESKIKKLTDLQLKNKSAELKKRYQKGESLDQMLTEAFALVREASHRTLGMRHFDVQLMGGVALHQGKIAEQKTGEGKTLTAVLAVYLNAIAGKGVHVVTVNDYLARRDAGWNGPIYDALGVSVAVIIHQQAFLFDAKYNNKDVSDKRLKRLKPVSRKEAYAADITYGTNNEFGFDYLRDNMAMSLENKVQRGHYFAIVDEVDSILIDEARTPLIISSPAQEPTQKYLKFKQIIDKLSPETDYVIDEKQRTSHLTDHGIIKVEKMLGVDNLFEKDFSALHHLEEALKARALFQLDKDYVVRDGEVIIVDEFTGRLMPGRRYSGGLHQAIEAKEGVQIQQESQTMATVSFQNYFRMYDKLAGMTGTAATEAEEFHKIYKLDVVIIPTNQDMRRKDHPDAIYKTITAKYTAVAAEIEKIHATGQPVLVGTTSIDKNEFLSDLLKRKKISHALLNAKNHEREAEIIADAGQKGAVTVATNLAGRGVDIKLGKGVEELGGLYVIGTERHESRRIDNQPRGRSGRQGDPGGTKFFVSLEDDLMRIFGGDQVAKVMNFLKMPEDTPIEHGLVSKAIESAQKKVEGHNFDIRKHTVEYDDVMNQQRQIIYGVRDQVLDIAAGKKPKSMSVSRDDVVIAPASSLKELILDKVDQQIVTIVSLNSQEGTDYDKIASEFGTIVPFDEGSKRNLVEQLKQIGNADQVDEFLIKLAHDLYDEKEKAVGVDLMRQMEVFVYLNTIDTFWLQHLDNMDDLRSGIGLRGYAQRDPLVEYKREGFDMFERMIVEIDSEISRRIYKVVVEHRHDMPIQPVANLTKAVEIHEEALDEQNLLEEVGALIPHTPVVREEPVIPGIVHSGTTVRVEGSSNDEAYNSGSVDRGISESVRQEPVAATKVTVEKGGQVVSQQQYGEQGQLNKAHGKIGRNDPCWCGSGKKYKKCHYPN